MMPVSFLRLLMPTIIAAGLLLPSGSTLAQTGDHHHHDDIDAAGPAEAHDGYDDAADIETGRMIYEMSCVFCHGVRGRGDGGAAIFLGPYSHPRPNDFTTATFKFRSTPSGELPMLTDLIRTIRNGIPGFMPAYRNIGEKRLRQVARYIESEFIGRTLPTETSLTFLDYPGPAARTPDSVRNGRRLYDEAGCAACHGADGSESLLHLHDQRGLTVMPMDLTRPEMFGNGDSPEDIYRTLMTGLDGTPMPAYAAHFNGRETELWDLVHYILWLGSPPGDRH